VVAAVAAAVAVVTPVAAAAAAVVAAVRIPVAAGPAPPVSAADTPVAPGAVDAPAVWSALPVSAPASVLSTPVAPGAVTPVLADAADAADAFSLEVAAVVAAVVVAAAGDPAGYGIQFGAGSTPAGRSLNLRLRYLLSRRSNPHRLWRVQEKMTGVSSPNEPNSIRQLHFNHVLRNSSGPDIL
jgi:hypothetical protein